MFKTQKQRTLRKRVASVLAGVICLSSLSTASVAAAGSPEAVKRGGEVTVGINEPFAGLCYTALVAGPALSAMSAVFEGLFTKTATGEPIGLLASHAVPSGDFTKWNIYLRPNISFTNGQPMNADAVIENMNYWRGAKYQFPATNLWTLGGGVAGFANIIGLRKIDDLTVGVDLFRPQNDLPELLSFPSTGLRASAQLATANDCNSKAIGTGPFTVVSIRTGELVLEANPNYWRRDPRRPNTKLPYLSKLTFSVAMEASQRAAAVRQGAFDAAIFTGRTDNTFIVDLEQRKSFVNVYRSPVHYYPSFFLNQGNGGPFSDLNARLAVTTCIDRARFNTIRMKGRGEVPTSIVGKENILYNPKGFTKFDVNKSKTYVAAYLAANPGKTSLSFNIPFEGSAQSQNTAKFLQATFAKCGITMNILTEEQAVWAPRAYNVANGNNFYDAVFTGSITMTGAALNFPFLATNAFPADSTNPLKMFRATLGRLYNLTKHTDTSVDDLLWQARAATTPAKAKVAYQAVTKKIQEQAIFTSVGNFGWAYVTNDKAKLSAPGNLQIKKGVKMLAVSPSWMDWAGLSKG